MSKIRISKKMPFSAVPDMVFSLDLSHTAIVILAWALGRPDGWEFYIGHMLRTLHLTEAKWATARKQLITAGFFVQTKGRDEKGKVVWENEFTDKPLFFPIPNKPMHGETKHGDTKDGKPMPDKDGDITENGDAKELSKVVKERRKGSLSLDVQLESRFKVDLPGSGRADPETGVWIANEKDACDLVKLLEQYGVESVKVAASKIVGRVWISKIAALLNQQSSNSAAEPKFNALEFVNRSKNRNQGYGQAIDIN